MQKQLTQFKSIIQGVENYFHFDASCPIIIAKEALFECMKWLGTIEDQAKASAEAVKNQEDPQEIEEKKEAIDEQPTA